MNVVGDQSKCYGLDNLERLAQVSLLSRPSEMPVLRGGHFVVAIYRRVVEPQVVICETIEDIQELWDAYSVGNLIELEFFSTDNEVGVIGVHPETEHP